MGERNPQLRSDLVIRRREEVGATAYIIKDPRSRRYFQFREPEIYIARQLDGATPLEDIRQGVERRFGVPLPAQSLRSFVDTLRKLDLLDVPSPQPAPVQSRLRARGSLLYLRWKLCDPDRILGVLANRLRWLFTPAFLGLSALLMIVALGVIVTNYHAIGRHLPALWRTDFLVFAWITMLGVLACHEFAHGVTCRHFGGHVHEMGFMLIFFHPAVYCNVSDAWLFPERRKRLWVTFAGAYFEMIVWSVATLLWWVTDPNTMLRSLALIIMLTSGVKTLFNLNPLIKLDGYYLLSDWLRIPNLNRRAVVYVRDRVRGCLGFGRQKTALDVPPRERRICLIYGALAMTFSIGLLTCVVWNLAVFLTSRYQAAGFLASGGLVFAFLRHPIRRTFTSRAAHAEQGVRHARGRRLLALALLFSGLTACLLLVRMELTVAAPFTVLPVNYAEVRAGVEGIVDEVLVGENDRVGEGQTIARLSDRAFRPELEKVQADITATAARLKMLKTGAREEEIELARREVETARMRHQRADEQFETATRVHEEQLARARTSIEKAETQLRAARDELDRIENFVANRIASAKELQDAAALVALREKELQEAQGDLRVASAENLAAYREAAAVAKMVLNEVEGRLDLLLAGSRAELIEVTEAELARLETHRDHLREQIQYLNIVAPLAGVITTPKLRELIGKRVDKGDLIATLQDLTRFRAEIAVPEKEMADVELGQAVSLKARAFPGVMFTGTVTSIAPIASSSDELVVGRAVLVSADIEDSMGRLKPEMTGNGKIHCGQRRVLDLVTRRLVRYVRVEFWSWW